MKGGVQKLAAISGFTSARGDYVADDACICTKTNRFRAAIATLGIGVLLATALSTPGGAASDGGFEVIVHRDNISSSLTRGQLDAIFLGKINVWPAGGEITVVNNVDDAIRNDFSKAIHARPEAAVNAYWAAKSFKDAVVPPIRLDDGETVAFIADNPGAIGYVRAGTPLQGVKPMGIEG